MEELLPCPFCGSSVSSHIYTVEDFEGGRPRLERAYVSCEDCGVEGPSGDTELDAVVGWNERPGAQRNEIIEECFQAARDTYLRVAKEFVLIGPGGIAMNICNAIRALKRDAA